MVNSQTVSINDMVSDLAERKRLTTTVQYEISNMGRELSDLSSLPPENYLPQTENEWEQSRLQIHSSIEALKKMDHRKETQELIAKFETLYNPYENLGEQIILLQKTKSSLSKLAC
jgi:two-component system chemotaxis sensor kinase CheA